MNTPAAEPSEKKAKVVIAGGSGLIGRALAKRLLDFGYQPVILSRNPDTNLPGIICARWDGKTLDPGSSPPWAQHFENAAAVVRLATVSPARCRRCP